MPRYDITRDNVGSNYIDALHLLYLVHVQYYEIQSTPVISNLKGPSETLEISVV